MDVTTTEQPSKYHRIGYVGESKECPSGRKWYWDSSHPDLEPTETFEVGCGHYCIYCLSQAYPIQAGLRPQGWLGEPGKDHRVTGRCCVCESAEAEKTFKKEMKELKFAQELRAKEERQELLQKYEKTLQPNYAGKQELLHKAKMRKIEQDKEYLAWERMRTLA